MKKILITLCLGLGSCLAAQAQKEKNELHFKSGQSQLITVYKGTVFVNGNKAFIFQKDNINYASKRNKLVEDGRTVFLFLEIDNAPNKNRFLVFNIDHSLADTVVNAIASDVKDWDGDGNLEFGGAENTPVYNGTDSAYYVASRFYEIKKGKISYDAALTEKTDLKKNKVFLTDPYDANGQPKLIPKRQPKR
ncbi:hypothetical protein [Chitinophaga sp. sic0106]|uniref:hypothetical protein n=1 Tax=Chitinophaga sp. sic0106 TaxID=2854785 RepID=UPI001C443798|nr:hypothetical protein [Chitinophaga sp. sic0106]MBV7529242.1 hypothetical protein [Chitinophaga sp. sic0106]